jgi:hypothetical protein
MLSAAVAASQLPLYLNNLVNLRQHNLGSQLIPCGGIITVESPKINWREPEPMIISALELLESKSGVHMLRIRAGVNRIQGGMVTLTRQAKRYSAASDAHHRTRCLSAR